MYGVSDMYCASDMYCVGYIHSVSQGFTTLLSLSPTPSASLTLVQIESLLILLGVVGGDGLRHEVDRLGEELVLGHGWRGGRGGRWGVWVRKDIESWGGRMGWERGGKGGGY